MYDMADRVSMSFWVMSAFWSHEFGRLGILAEAKLLDFHTNLQTTLDKVEGYYRCVREAAAQDTPKATQGIVLGRAKLAATFLCVVEGDNKHATCKGSHAKHKKRGREKK